MNAFKILSESISRSELTAGRRWTPDNAHRAGSEPPSHSAASDGNVSGLRVVNSPVYRPKLQNAAEKAPKKDRHVLEDVLKKDRHVLRTQK